LMIAGALACFGAGTAMPQLQTLMFGDLRSWQTVASATRPSSTPVADVAVKPDASTRAGPKLSESTSDTSNLSTAPNTSGMSPPTASSPDRSASAVDQSAPAGKEASASCGVPCDQQPCPRGDPNCLEGAAANPPTPLTTGAGTAAESGTAQAIRSPSADSQRAETRASSRQEERAQSSRHNRRSVQRDTADQQRARRNVPTVSRSVRWQERDTNQASTWRWDGAADDEVVAARPWGSRQDGDADRGAKWWRDDSLPTARSSGRRQDRDADQASSWRRDRYDEYPRGDDRRVFDRTAREDDRVIGRAKRDEGPLVTFPPARYRW
jgi:hypothetical protein